MKVFLVLLALLSAAIAGFAAPEYPDKGPDVYDTKADGFALIDSALSRARTEHKRVILDFGANWCPWCRKLDHTFNTDPQVKAALDKGFIVVSVDVNRRKGPPRNAAVNEKYGNPIKDGIPVLVVLDQDGHSLGTQDTGDLESGDHHDPAKILSFLKKYATTP